MSLNGLEDSAVTEAYQSSLAEAGGWFLLHYTSRDTVALLRRGSGGVLETRAAIEQYEEKSPLYGLIYYRRKKFVLKYVPEGTSRVLQVRLTVQFQSILDTFTPYDTIFSFSDASELTDAALGTSAMLGTRAGSLKSSSSSLRRQRLGEITEHADEGDSGQRRYRGSLMSEVRTPSVEGRSHAADRDMATGMASAVEAKTKAKTSNTQSPSVPPTLPEILPQPRIEVIPTPSNIRPDKSLPVTPEPTPPQSSKGLLLSQENLRALEAQAQKSEEQQGALLSPQKHPQQHPYPLADADGVSQYSYTPSYLSAKPKTKRAPRPHVEPHGRPKTSDSAKIGGQSRRVANLPTSIQISNRTTTATPLRPESQQSSKSVPTRPTAWTTPFEAPPLPTANNVHIASMYKAPQPRPSPQRSSSALAITPSATPEKLRLMKALQMRKKNMEAVRRTSGVTQISVDSTSQKHAVGNADTAFEHDTSVQPSVASEQPEVGSKQTAASSTASPVSTTHLSAEPSTRSSLSNHEAPTARTSISSDTGSSVTPKAAAENQPSIHVVPLPAEPDEPQPPPERSTRLSLATQDMWNEQKPAVNSPKEVEHAKALADLHRHDEEHDEEPASIPRTAQSATKEPVLTNSERAVSHQRVVSNASTATRDKRRRGLPDPLQIISSPTASEASEDEAFMDELQYAKVEEAKPISVARSPATPIFSRGSTDRLKDLSRATSMPSEKLVENPKTPPDRPKTSSTRSVSSNLPQWPPTPTSGTPPVPLAKKGTLSSGISKRIKALEVFSNRDSISSPAPTAPQHASKSRFGLGSIRKRNSFAPQQQAPNMSTSIPPPKDLPQMKPVETLVANVPEGAAVQSRPWVQRQGSITEMNTPTQKGDSISVTARIIRSKEPTQSAAGTDPSEPVQMNLHRSPLIFEHEKGETREVRPTFPRDVSFQSQEAPAKSSQDRPRFSLTSHRSNSQGRLHTSDSMASQLSSSSPKKRGPSVMARALSETSSITEEKGSRASRLKKRMSVLSMGSRRSLMGAFAPKSQKENQSVATIVEHNEVSSVASDQDSLPHVVDVGDLNVQFPDTLLWKRRFMEIDDHGYVIFAPPRAEKNSRGHTRRFHLSDFKKPALPDIERQEMAWSIRLELNDGSCVQCACESKQTQSRVLKVLVNAHTAYHQLYAN